jgi:hypothetical protein
MTSDDRYRAVEAARTAANLSVQELWLRYLAIGGSSDAFDIDGYLQGLVPLEGFQQDVLAQAVNEGLDDVYRSLRVPLSAFTIGGAGDDAVDAIVSDLLARRQGAVEMRTPAGGEEQPPAGPAVSPLER